MDSKEHDNSKVIATSDVKSESESDEKKIITSSKMSIVEGTLVNLFTCGFAMNDIMKIFNIINIGYCLYHKHSYFVKVFVSEHPYCFCLMQV